MPVLPTLVAHADWSKDPKKRWMAVATRAGTSDRYLVEGPENVTDASTMIERLLERGNGGPILVGFDFPIGIPRAYAEKAGVESFPWLLERIGTKPWDKFKDAAKTREEISIYQPFYPNNGKPKGAHKKEYLPLALGVKNFEELMRDCERGAQGGKKSASSLFFTCGAQQVGKAAVAGWTEVLQPTISRGDTALWPFAGNLEELLSANACVLCETYPANALVQLNISGGSKTKLQWRLSKAKELLNAFASTGADLSPEMTHTIESGFPYVRKGKKKDGTPTDVGEDPFDAAVGLAAMLKVVRNPAQADINNMADPKVEGWILGLEKISTPSQPER